MALFLTTFGLVFAAELGDKTQLLAMAFAAKYKPWKVLTGVLISVSLLNLIAVLLGTYITSVIPINVIRIIAACVFLIFGIFNLKESDKEEKERSFNLGAILTVALTFFIGELGDKTQLMAITLAAQFNSPYQVFLGSTAGMIIADSLGIIVGCTVLRKIPTFIVKVISSGIFILFGTLGLYNSLPSRFITPATAVLYAIIMVGAIFAVYRSNSSKNLKE